MKLFLKKIIKKYRDMSVEMKAASWYAVGNIIQKIAPWLVMIILTHYLATEEYGIYSIFMSWLEIFEIIITLRIYSNGYVAGLVRDDENRTIYTATMQSLSIVLIVIWTLMYLMFHKGINYITGISTPLSILMICSFIGTISFGLWSSRQRVDNQYKKMLFAIIVYGLIGPIVGALTVFLNLDNPIFYVIATRTVIQLGVAIPFFISNYKGTSTLWKKDYAIDALKYNLPLMPYYLSMILLNHSDRLMIQKIDGYEDAALYSVSYSAAMVIFVISGALNLSLQAWLFKELKLKDSSKDKSKLITVGTIIVAFCAIAEIVMAPEIILILGGKKYLKAIWVMPPLAISVIVMYIYQQYVNILFYYKKTKFILFASVFAAVCNIILPRIRVKIEQEKCDKIYANKILKLPDKEKANVGFTCTGLYWDKEEECFFIGNAGKYKPNDKTFQASIEIVEKDFSAIKGDIPCYLKFENMRDIQGVTKSTDGTIWLCSYGENKVRHIDEKGNELGNFDIKEPSGIANDSKSNTLWTLTNNYLYNCSYDGVVQKSIKIHIKGQDQLFLDEKNDLIYFSAGADYHGDSYIYTVDLKTSKVKPLYVLKDSYAIEGITIVDDVLYVLNDGYYHDAETPINQVNMYFLNKMQTKENYQ